ncbi:MAG: TIGR02281 family clan AA aspartic protease [Stappia sp.]|jgi:aspartyl protease family protein|uniref:retropepsin-like aspartic protease family protein n=1 Tax=Stappia sp. TaxID=1870903 RepID=UPI000C61B015|nr:TIGR02281 family clan AA aspartic protease [Stappia sp.]MAB00262.1 TIGR02281 family clan AA aspartic protease [Stappia sp.]MBM21013.1 TIGR02281 family clan AA aspartic protease [Stappia sp.]|tara:strand:- start:300 stop:812 length:513 start_codon:yes stop_codon:yes gene_type:complete
MERYLFIAIGVAVIAMIAPKAADMLVVANGGPASVAVATNEPEPARGPRTLVLSVGENGHYSVDAHINGRPVHSLIDTGASVVALPADVARASGLHPAESDFKVPVNTANGTARAARVSLRELRLGTIRLKNVDALVLPDGALHVPLIGMSALNRLAKVDIRSGTMRLIQ